MHKICIFLISALVLGTYAKSDEKEKLVGADYATVGEFPYQVSLRINGQHFCGGALITDRHVLTAAHCVYAAKKIGAFNVVTAVVGTNSLRYGGKSYVVIGKSAHPDYVDQEIPDWTNDIGIVTLASSCQMSKLVSLVKLPTKDIKVNTEAVISGWGTQVNPKSGLSNNLQKLKLNIIDTASCKNRMPYFAKIHSSMICTYVKRGVGTCSGDSGGPLVQDGVIIGVVSGGIPCAIGYPDVFTSVYKFLNYVKSVINQ